MQKWQKTASQHACGKRSAAEHENHSHSFIAILGSHTCLKQQKKVSQDTCAECAAAEQVNCSPTFVAYFPFALTFLCHFSICTYISLPFFGPARRGKNFHFYKFIK
jgi:hypothetical protein